MDEESQSLLSAEDGKIHPCDYETKICPDKCEKHGKISRKNNYQAVTDLAEDGGDDRLELILSERIVSFRTPVVVEYRGISPLIIDSRVQKKIMQVIYMDFLNFKWYIFGGFIRCIRVRCAQMFTQEDGRSPAS